MVIRTEYRGQRYSMGSSDPLPAGLVIRFGGLNFQATRNATSCASLTVRNSARSARPGPPRSPPHASPRHQRRPARMLWVLRRHGAAAAPANTHDRRDKSTGM
jgi:hypothetical protein